MADKSPIHNPEWITASGPCSDIVLSSRVRLARNLEKIPYPPRAHFKDLQKSLDLINKTLSKNRYLKDSIYYKLDDLSDLDKQVLVEEYLISPALAQESGPRDILIDPKGALSIMINEEDHLRIQCILSGLQLEKSWSYINKIDDSLEKRLDFAFSDKWGYLATCPTNVGTGMRASVMLHLPALVLTNLIPKVIPTITQLGLAVRGFYGEGTESEGHFFQISNQVSLGLSESDILSKIKGITLQIVEQEQSARKNIQLKVSYQIADKVWRAFGILRHAYMMTSAEALELLSMVRLGVCMKILPAIPMNVLNEMVILTRPAYLQKALGKTLTPAKRDKERAGLMREKLKFVNAVNRDYRESSA